MADDLVIEENMLSEDPKIQPDLEEDFDAFNADTFGDEEEWQEEAHEELAKLTEEERLALEQSNDFFGFGGDDSGEELEPTTESNGQKKDFPSQFEQNLTLNETIRNQEQRFKPPPDDPAILNVMRQPQLPGGLNQQPSPQVPHEHQVRMSMGYPPMPQQMIPQGYSLPGIPPGLPVHRMPQFQDRLDQNILQQRANQALPPQIPPQQLQQRSLQDIEREMMEQASRQRAIQQHQQQLQNLALHQERMHYHHYNQKQPQQQYSHPQHHQNRHRYSSQQFHHGDRGHYQHQHRGNQGRGRYNNNYDYYRGSRSDDRNRETFGDDFVTEALQEQQFHHEKRRLMTPGHVHALGILRGARERFHQHQQRESTGNPQLDMELERRQQDYDHEWRNRYFDRSSNDPYAGLMTPRERQWIINIQLQQLKCENPFVDDYYYTVYNHKKAQALAAEEEAEDSDEHSGRQLKRNEEGPQLLLSSDAQKEEQYRPVQFTNSLGKLQAVSVKAPRKIIDVNVVKEDSLEASGPNASQKESRNYKNTLMEIERLYVILIEAEDCEKKLAALPTHTVLRKQVQDEMAEALAKLNSTLVSENRIKRYLMVRKGKILLKRALRMMEQACLQLFCSTLFQLFPIVIRKDKEEKLIHSFWPELKRHIRSASFELLRLYMTLLNAGANSRSTLPKFSHSTFRHVLASPLGTSIIVILLNSMFQLFSSLEDEEKIEVKDLVSDLLKELDDGSLDIAKPLEPMVFKTPILDLEEKHGFMRLVNVAKIGGLEN